MDKLYPCYRCKESKTAEHFFKDKSRPTGLCNKCKTCGYQLKNNWNRKNHVPRVPKSKEEKLLKRREQRNKWLSTPYGRLSNNLRNRLKGILKDNMPQNKKTSTRAYFSENLGCKTDQFVKHITSLWYPHPVTGAPMTWDNYGALPGQWNLDHKRPIKDFLDKGEDPRKANHFQNIAPMWAEENYRKGAKLDF